MSDPSARFAAKLARSVGRLDWWNVYDEHTPYEWALQVAMFAAEPWGEDREDLRMALAAALNQSAHAAEPVQAEKLSEMFDQYRKYLPVHRVDAGENSEFIRDENAMKAIAAIKGH